MKKYIILLAVAACGILSSCSTYTATPRSTFEAFLDFRPYLAEGFYICSTPYNGEATALGELIIDVTPELKEIRYEQREKYDAIIVDFDRLWGHEYINAEELLKQAVEAAKKVGANGLGSFKIEKAYSGNRPVYQVRATCLKIEK